jgi:hypothetical protein
MGRFKNRIEEIREDFLQEVEWEPGLRDKKTMAKKWNGEIMSHWVGMRVYGLGALKSLLLVC